MSAFVGLSCKKNLRISIVSEGEAKLSRRDGGFESQHFLCYCERNGVCIATEHFSDEHDKLTECSFG